jgi:hypothetical protein
LGMLHHPTVSRAPGPGVPSARPAPVPPATFRLRARIGSRRRAATGPAVRRIARRRAPALPPLAAPAASGG